MKKQVYYFLLTAIFMVQFGFASSMTDYAAVKGKISYPEAKIKEVSLYGVDAGIPVVVATSKLNASGEFAFMVPVAEAGFYYVDYGQFRRRGRLIRLYLEPKTDVELSITKEACVLGGNNIGQNALVQKANEVYNDFASYSNMTRETGYEPFYAFIDSGLAKAEALKKSIDTKDKNFNKLLKLAVDTDVEELMYLFFRMPSKSFPAKDDRPAAIKQWQTADKRFADTDLLKLANGVSLMSNFFFYKSMNGDKIPSRGEAITNAFTHIIAPALKDAYLRYEISVSKMKMEEYESIAPIVRPYMTSEASKEFLLEYEKVLHKNAGQKGFEFTYKDVNDKPVSFSDFKGKYVFIDLWATWCGPCKAQIPYMKKLEEDYHGKNIVFISLSLDAPKDQQKWKDFVATQKLTGIQIMADKAFDSDIAKNYEVKAIPRFLLFDTKGNIINADAARPSSEELRVALDKLLKQ